MTLSYGSVCSGIEAASVAWHPLGWRADWLAEIEPFPSAVLAHHYPDTPNLGDMTKIASKVLNGSVAAPDILVGGTPCQAFSVAGMREGLADPRGALTIKFVELADAIDHVRARQGKEPAIVVWENVPGVLSDKGNAFGCFLGALAGEDCELQPSGPRWTDAGCVYGPRRAVAWRVLDAQYFGLAQRRRRVFVVASARGGLDPAAVLFEREGMRRDTPPRRGEGQDVAGHAPFGPALQCGCGYLFPESLGHWGCPACEGEDGPGVSVLAGVPAFGGGNQSGSLFQGGTLLAKAQRGDFESETFCVHGTQDPCVSDKAFALGRNSGQENAVLSIALRGREGGGTIEAGDEVAGCLRASTGGGDKPHALIHSAIRRLTPRECERLQGLSDDYTLIPWRGKPAEECPDGPRYKAIGNSKAVPVVRWIGQRIAQHLEAVRRTA
ncbi:DNA cytosine methyltransferase [Azotobacter chroococcum]|uniref:DNA cytosine methyltransferase n=1 Tax=Azotobacter chroococcum TaxID=353 RepID=UPI0010AE8408|nr:DNA cytosine methyltransferase [Azotobacter chroococcum]TKD30023.1 DNA cytosine methyltransferase [Azotobacter chroococcum]